MKKISLLLFVLSCFSAFGQSIEKLDEKNGFKEIDLGDKYSKWERELKYDGHWDDGSLAYLYTGTCCETVFNYPVEKIRLRFSKDKLVGIYITTKKFQTTNAVWRSQDYESIKNSFSSLFGEPTSVDIPQDSTEITHIWAGKKVVLFSMYEFLGQDNGDRQQIIVADLLFFYRDINHGY